MNIIQVHTIAGCRYCTTLKHMLKKAGKNFTVVQHVGDAGDTVFPYCIYKGKRYEYKEALEEFTQWKKRT